jgi:hypothetical protein
VHCPALAHLDLSGNSMGTVGGGRLRASWRWKGSAGSGLVLEEEREVQEEEQV